MKTILKRNGKFKILGLSKIIGIRPATIRKRHIEGRNIFSTKGLHSSRVVVQNNINEFMRNHPERHLFSRDGHYIGNNTNRQKYTPQAPAPAIAPAPKVSNAPKDLRSTMLGQVQDELLNVVANSDSIDLMFQLLEVANKFNKQA